MRINESKVYAKIVQWNITLVKNVVIPSWAERHTLCQRRSALVTLGVAHSYVKPVGMILKITSTNGWGNREDTES